MNRGNPIVIHIFQRYNTNFTYIMRVKTKIKNQPKLKKSILFLEIRIDSGTKITKL